MYIHTVLANPTNVANVCTHSRRCLDSLTSCLQSCVTTGNAKVQWMACSAVHALFTNTQLQALPQAHPPISSLLLLLTMLVRDSANFKVCVCVCMCVCVCVGVGVGVGVLQC